VTFLSDNFAVHFLIPNNYFIYLRHCMGLWPAPAKFIAIENRQLSNFSKHYRRTKKKYGVILGNRRMLFPDHIARLELCHTQWRQECDYLPCLHLFHIAQIYWSVIKISQIILNYNTIFQHLAALYCSMQVMYSN
jgi:hypothetical protein